MLLLLPDVILKIKLHKLLTKLLLLKKLLLLGYISVWKDLATIWDISASINWENISINTDGTIYIDIDLYSAWEISVVITNNKDWSITTLKFEIIKDSNDNWWSDNPIDSIPDIVTEEISVNIDNSQMITVKNPEKEILQNQITTLETKLTELNSQKAKLEQDLKNAWNSAEAIKKIQNQINAINTSINSLINDKNTLNSQKSSTETQITSKTNDINNTFNNLDPLSKSLADWNNSLTTKQVLLNNNFSLDWTSSRSISANINYNSSLVKSITASSNSINVDTGLQALQYKRDDLMLKIWIIKKDVDNLKAIYDSKYREYLEKKDDYDRDKALFNDYYSRYSSKYNQISSIWYQSNLWLNFSSLLNNVNNWSYTISNTLNTVKNTINNAYLNTSSNNYVESSKKMNLANDYNIPISILGNSMTIKIRYGFYNNWNGNDYPALMYLYNNQNWSKAFEYKVNNSSFLGNLWDYLKKMAAWWLIIDHLNNLQDIYNSWLSYWKVALISQDYYKQELANYNNAKSNYDVKNALFNSLVLQLNDINNKITALWGKVNEKSKLDSNLQTINTNINNTQSQIDTKTQEKTKLESDKNNISNTDVTTINNNLTNINSQITSVNNNIKNTKNTYNNAPDNITTPIDTLIENDRISDTKTSFAAWEDRTIVEINWGDYNSEEFRNNPIIFVTTYWIENKNTNISKNVSKNISKSIISNDKSCNYPAKTKAYYFDNTTKKFKLAKISQTANNKNHLDSLKKWLSNAIKNQASIVWEWADKISRIVALSLFIQISMYTSEIESLFWTEYVRYANIFLTKSLMNKDNIYWPNDEYTKILLKTKAYQEFLKNEVKSRILRKDKILTYSNHYTWFNTYEKISPEVIFTVWTLWEFDYSYTATWNPSWYYDVVVTIKDTYDWNKQDNITNFWDSIFAWMWDSILQWTHGMYDTNILKPTNTTITINQKIYEH